MACRGMVGLGLAQRGAACFAGWTWKNLSSSTATTTPTDFAWVTDTAAPAAHVARTTWNVAVAFICFLSTMPSCCCFRCSLNGGSVADGVSNCMCLCFLFVFCCLCHIGRHVLFLFHHLLYLLVTTHVLRAFIFRKTVFFLTQNCIWSVPFCICGFVCARSRRVRKICWQQEYYRKLLTSSA